MPPALEAVVANHIESRAPIVLERDFILPVLSTSFSESSIQSQVRTLFLYEESEEQFRHNFLQREPEPGLQEKCAQVSWLYGQWLKQEAERVGALTIPARPWNDLFERGLTLPPLSAAHFVGAAGESGTKPELAPHKVP
jgi:hypothetical protein